MTYREGVGKNGRPWKAYFCPTPKGTADQCPAVWLDQQGNVQPIKVDKNVVTNQLLADLLKVAVETRDLLLLVLPSKLKEAPKPAVPSPFAPKKEEEVDVASIPF